jgi:hypothetical protein
VSVRVPTSLARDLAPDDLVGCAPFSAPIGRKFVNYPQAPSAVLVLCRRAQHGATTSLVFHLDAHPVGIRMDGHANRPWGMDNGIGHELADQQQRHLDDRRLHPVVGQNVAYEDASFTNAGGPAQELDRTGHRFRVPRARLRDTRASHTERGCGKEARPLAHRDEAAVFAPLRPAPVQIVIALSIGAPPDRPATAVDPRRRIRNRRERLHELQDVQEGND